MIAAYNSHVEVVKVLLEKGASVNAADNSGKTVLQYAEAGGNAEIIELLRNAVNSQN